MRLLFGVVAYLAAVAAVVAAAFVAVLMVFDDRPKEQPVLASDTDGRAAGTEREREERMRADPNRVPVWIAPTAKYQYTPIPADPGPKRTPVIGGDAHGAMAKSRNARGQTVLEENQITGLSSSDPVPKRRDNDPFFRD